MVDLKPWISRAERTRDGGGYTYQSLAQDLVDRLGWTAALDVATALRGYVYSQAGHSELHTSVRPIYEALGWEQAALLASWFRDARNRPDARPRERPSGRRPGSWPVAASPTTHTTEIKETSCPT